jgi:peptidoglycan/LPS O-acetylase OafA/YrhL
MGRSCHFFRSERFLYSSQLFKRARAWLARYFIKRTFRIYPPYLISLLIVSFSYPWLEIYKTSGVECFVYHALMIHNFSEDCFFAINPAYWSISIELQLYVIYIGLFLMASKFGWNAVIFTTLLIEMGLRIYSMQNTKYPQMIVGSPFFYVFSWTIGARICEIRLAHEKTKVRLWMPFTLLTVAVGCQFVKPLFIFSFPLLALSTATFSLCANFPERCPTDLQLVHFTWLD